MKKTLIILGVINAGLVFLVLGLLFLAETYPFRPGGILFDVQSFAESTQVRLTSDPARRAERSFELVERRLLDLTLSKPQHLKKAILAFDDSLSAAIRNIETVPNDQKEALYRTVEKMLVRIDIVLSGLEKSVSSDSLATMREKIAALQAASTPVEIQKIVQEKPKTPALILSQAIPFIGEEVDHSIFPLEGGHADVECETCHETGEYADTPKECASCHTLDEELVLDTEYLASMARAAGPNYPLHYQGDCANCHVDTEWSEIIYDHAHVFDCVSCHAGDIPLEQASVDETPRFVRNVLWKYNAKPATATQVHYPGDCKDCHTSFETWEEYEFDHHQGTCQSCHGVYNFTDIFETDESCLRIDSCQECHNYDGHEEKYPGDCTNCHTDVNDWLNIQVNHDIYPNCVQCHLDDKPNPHSVGQCSDCHVTSNWSKVYFKHDASTTNCASCHDAPHGNLGSDCGTCHSTLTWRDSSMFHNFTNCSNCHNAPAGHYPAACTACHVTGSWSKVSFNHTGITTCTQCHAVPSHHYPGACLSCHNTNNWSSISFNHAGVTTCSNCHPSPSGHYAGDCNRCHITANWTQVHFDHTGYTTCTTCHATPSNHYPGDCTLCHNTSSWVDAYYSHNSNDNCTSCHATPSGHWPGQCSKCHNTNEWVSVVFDHTGYTDCKSCHDRPADHSRGQCSKCHNTTTWYLPPTPTAVITTAVPSETPSVTPEPSETPSVTPDPSETPSETPDPSETPSETPDPSETPSETPDPSDTPDPSETQVEDLLPVETPVP